MDHEKVYKEALEQAKKELATCGSMDCDAARLIFRLFPQLRESDDERVIRTLFSLCKDHDWLNGATKEECLNWLEKQKEFLHVSEICKENADSFTDEDERTRKWIIEKVQGYADSGIPCSDEIQMANKALAYLKHQKEPENTSASTMAPSCWEVGQKEQKPWKVGANAYFTPEQKPVEWNANDKAFIKDCANILVANDYAASAERLLSMFPIKPVEWSDTNELVFKDICKHLKEEGYNGWIVLLNALRNGEFQPKQEWSEEDKKMIDTIVSVLGQYIDYKAVSGTGSGYATPRYSKEIDWLKSLRHSWKPSELHLSALLAVFNDPNNIDSQTCQLALTDLYEHLKKMI